ENWHIGGHVVPAGHRHLPHSLVHEPSLIPPHNDGDGVVHVDVGVISPTPESSAIAVGVDNTNGVGRIGTDALHRCWRHNLLRHVQVRHHRGAVLFLRADKIGQPLVVTHLLHHCNYLGLCLL